MAQEHPVLFKPKGKKNLVPEGCTLLSAALEIGLTLRHNCGGNATCGTCRVHIEDGMENLSPVNEREIDLLGEERIGQHFRLACQARVHGPVVARIPSWFSIPDFID